jgi:cytidine deaminase
VSAPGIEKIDRAEASARLRQFKTMLEMAEIAASRAYAPYSGFHVGAAVLAGSGRAYMGANVESASYGATICAERSAIAAAVAAGETEIKACVVITPTPEPSSPCGICRQLLAEFGPEVAVFAACRGDGVAVARLGDLLPASFGGADLRAAAQEGAAKGGGAGERRK